VTDQTIAPAGFADHFPHDLHCPGCEHHRFPAACPCGGLCHRQLGEELLTPIDDEVTAVEHAVYYWCDGCGSLEGP
jgi:hypothetical protein